MLPNTNNPSCKRLIFAYIPHYRSLHNVNLNFDGEYSISYDAETKCLSIKRNENCDSDFWPDAVSSVSVIAGQNGSGKTSILRWLLEKTLPCGNDNGLKGIVVIHDGDNLNVYYDIDEVKPIAEERLKESDSKINYYDTSRWNAKILANELGINPIYYSGHFDSFIGDSKGAVDDYRIWNISDQALLRKDGYGLFAGMMEFADPSVKGLFDLYHQRNDIRICRLLFDRKFQDTFSDKNKFILRLPRYIVFSRKEDVNEYLENKINSLTYPIVLNDGTVLEPSEESESELHVLEEINSVRPNEYMSNQKVGLSLLLYDALRWYCFQLYGRKTFNSTLKNRIINLFTHDYPSTSLSAIEWIQKCKEWAKKEENQSNSKVLEKDRKEILEFFSSLEKTLKFLEKLKWRDGEAYIDCVSTVKDSGFQRPHGVQNYADHPPHLNNQVFNDISELERFCNIYYRHNLTEGSSLSSGELAMLNLYSRIKYALDTTPSSECKNRPFLLILDEAEIGFHPEWQRQFVNKITQFVSKINKGDIPIQIIYTTHSPITLSDMPKECVNLLKVVNNESTNVPAKEKKETFGSNVFELYGDSFFMQQGLIGEFAAEKIVKLSAEIDTLVRESEELSKVGKNINDIRPFSEGNTIQKLRHRIDTIGDKRIKTYLHSRLDKVETSEEILRLKERLAYLEGQLNNRYEKD